VKLNVIYRYVRKAEDECHETPPGAASEDTIKEDRKRKRHRRQKKQECDVSRMMKKVRRKESVLEIARLVVQLLTPLAP
jgi:hypothetical protein